MGCVLPAAVQTPRTGSVTEGRSVLGCRPPPPTALDLAVWSVGCMQWCPLVNYLAHQMPGCSEGAPSLTRQPQAGVFEPFLICRHLLLVKLGIPEGHTVWGSLITLLLGCWGGT